MRGFFSIELLLIFFLIPNLLYLIEGEKFILVRETESYAQDAAQVYLYGYEPNGSMGIWIDLETPDCDFDFLYCTHRYKGGEHKICAAECLP